MAKSRFNIKAISGKILNSKKLNHALDVRAERRVYQARDIMVEDFKSHPVSEEIKAGASATNSSRTLGGYGNLFTFIGFPSHRNPIEAIAHLIRRKSYLIRRAAKKRVRGKRIIKTYLINYPSLQDINESDEAKMPWESGSWIQGIEEGISSFSSYMYRNFASGRSKMGVQAKKGGKPGGEDLKVRDGTYSPMKYVTQIIHDFRLNIISGAGRSAR